MYVYEIDQKIYCPFCYTKLVSEKERKPIHMIEGIEFYHRFRETPVYCAGCDTSIQHGQLHKATYQSFGGRFKKED